MQQSYFEVFITVNLGLFSERTSHLKMSNLLTGLKLTKKLTVITLLYWFMACKVFLGVLNNNTCIVSSDFIMLVLSVVGPLVCVCYFLKACYSLDKIVLSGLACAFFFFHIYIFFIFITTWILFFHD